MILEPLEVSGFLFALFAHQRHGRWYRRFNRNVPVGVKHQARRRRLSRGKLRRPGSALTASEAHADGAPRGRPRLSRSQGGVGGQRITWQRDPLQGGWERVPRPAGCGRRRAQARFAAEVDTLLNPGAGPRVVSHLLLGDGGPEDGLRNRPADGGIVRPDADLIVEAEPGVPPPEELANHRLVDPPFLEEHLEHPVAVFD